MRFDRDIFLAAMERLHAYYSSEEGLQRSNGLSINNAPDFEGIAAWVFDVFLNSIAAGQSTEEAWLNIVASIENGGEWADRHPGQTPRPLRRIPSGTGFSRNEFRAAMNRLDNYYRSCQGLKRPNGLSLNEAPDFLGIAAWIFDVYLNARLDGQSVSQSFDRIIRYIEAGEEWKIVQQDPSRPCVDNSGQLYSGPAEFAPFVNRFVADGIIQGLDVTSWMTNPKLTIEFGNLSENEGRTVGLCALGLINRDIRIDANYWVTLDEAGKEVLLYHELGHCVLTRAHVMDVREDYNPVSMMYPVVLSGFHYTQLKNYYQHELFTQGIGSWNTLSSHSVDAQDLENKVHVCEAR